VHHSCPPPRVIPLHRSPDGTSDGSMAFNDTPRTDAVTQGCRDFIRSLTYEAILACTVYGPPMLFMIGPTSIVTNHPLVLIALNSLLGFGMSWTIHCMGHRLLIATAGAAKDPSLETAASPGEAVVGAIGLDDGDPGRGRCVVRNCRKAILWRGCGDERAAFLAWACTVFPSRLSEQTVERPVLSSPHTHGSDRRRHQQILPRPTLLLSLGTHTSSGAVHLESPSDRSGFSWFNAIR